MIPSPQILLCTILLNEREWIDKLYAQHRHWPGKVGWVFVEGADAEYARVNPDRVSPDGLSVDGTTDFLKTLQEQDRRVTYIPFGLATATDKAQGKCALRQRYLEAAEYFTPDILIVLDADEFYPKAMQERINATVAGNPDADAFVFRHREIWHPPYLQPGTGWREGVVPTDRFKHEVTGGFWSIPYCRVWRWQPGLRYASNHNTPETADGVLLDAKTARYEVVEGAPYYCHMAFASSAESRTAKHRYYEERGEKVDRRRAWYCDSRRSWFNWRPGDTLDKGAKVQPYDGIVPECFQ